MSSATKQIAEPTRTHYQCPGCGPLSFKWTRRMPKGGWLGEVTIGQYTNTPVQVFDAKPLPGGGTDWAFQAQDGSFLGHMYVSVLKFYVRFAKFRPGDQFPQVTCSAASPDPADSREPIDKVR